MQVGSIRRFLAGAAFAAAIFVGAATGAAAAPSYRITTLATPGGSYGGALGINANGDVVGSAVDNATGNTRPVLWSGGTFQWLNTNDGIAWAINNKGDIAGSDSNGAVTWLGPTTNVLGGDGANLSGGSFYAINNSGVAVGSAYLYHYDPSASYHAVRADPGATYTDLGTLGGNSEAWGINDAGLIVGYSQYAGGNGYTHAWIYDATGMHDIGALAGPQSAAYAINGAGLVVGSTTYSDDPTLSHAFAWINGTWTDLGSVKGGTEADAYGVNNLGDIVGVSSVGLWSGDFNDLHAALWHNGQGYDLNDLIDPTSGWRLVTAGGINDRGQIAGWGYLNGSISAFVLTPAPEPATWAQMALGFGLLCAAVRRRRASGTASLPA
jgi:probable HAF family extracellular repeat protein